MAAISQILLGLGAVAVSPPVFPGITNYSVNDRSSSGGAQGIFIPSSDASPTPSASASLTLSFPAANGSGVTYEWQFLTYYRFAAFCTNAQNTTPLVGSAQTWNGPSGYNDSISGASSNSITITGRPYLGTAAYHGVAGFWRLKASNSGGATYTTWNLVSKVFGTYEYGCNCTCPCGYNDCNCDENNENCSQCCDNCSEICDTCVGYSQTDLGSTSTCNW